MITSEFVVAGMTCGHCEKAVHAEVSQITGVRAIEISVATGKLRVIAGTPVEDQQILNAVDEAGYQAVRV